MPSTTKEIIEAFQNLRNFTKIEIAEKCVWYSREEVENLTKHETKVNIEIIDNGYLIEIFAGRSKVGSKFFKEIPHKDALNKYIEGCKEEFKELSQDEN